MVAACSDPQAHEHLAICYRRHRFPPQTIAHAVWVYLRFPLSLRLAEEMQSNASKSGAFGVRPRPVAPIRATHVEARPAPPGESALMLAPLPSTSTIEQLTSHRGCVDTFAIRDEQQTYRGQHSQGDRSLRCNGATAALTRGERVRAHGQDRQFGNAD